MIVHQDSQKRGRSLNSVLIGATEAVYDNNEFICGEMGGSGMWARQGDYKVVAVVPHSLGNRNLI